MSNQYIVIGFYENEGQICGDHVFAKDGEEALQKIAKMRLAQGGGDYNLIVAVKGNWMPFGKADARILTYVGGSIADCATVLGVTA